MQPFAACGRRYRSNICSVRHANDNGAPRYHLEMAIFVFFDDLHIDTLYRLLHRYLCTVRPSQSNVGIRVSGQVLVTQGSKQISQPLDLTRPWKRLKIIELGGASRLVCFYRYLPGFAACYNHLGAEDGPEEESWTMRSS